MLFQFMQALAQGCMPTSPADFWRSPLFILILVMVGILIIQSRMKRKRQQQRQETLSTITKGTRIMTIGGIYGTVVQVREDKNTVVIKIDEATNTKMEIAKSAIRSPVGTKEGDDTGGRP